MVNPLNAFTTWVSTAWHTRNVVIEQEEDYVEEDENDINQDIVVTAPQARRERTTDQNTMIYTSGLADRLKDKSIIFTGVVGSYLIALILGFGNGYFFSDFRFLSWDAWVLFSYLGGFLLEFIAINVLFKSSKHWNNKEYPQFALTFLVVLLFAVGTVVTQYLMMKAQLQAHGIIITDSMVEQIPVLNVVVGIAGLHGAAGFLVFRAFMFHMGELACVFLVPTRQPDVEETMKRSMELSRQRAAMAQQEGIQQVQSSLDGLLQVAIQAMVDNISTNVTHMQAPPQTTIREEQLPTPVQRTTPPVQRPTPPPVSTQAPRLPEASTARTQTPTGDKNLLVSTPQKTKVSEDAVLQALHMGGDINLDTTKSGSKITPIRRSS